MTIELTDEETVSLWGILMAVRVEVDFDKPTESVMLKITDAIKNMKTNKEKSLTKQIK
jgi:hypothetical protein